MRIMTKSEPTERLRTQLRLNQQTAAALAGVSIPTFQNLLKGPYPPPRSADSTYDVPRLAEWLRDYIIRKNSVITSTDSALLNPQQELARKNKELADKTALENETRRGELIETDDVEAAWTDILARVKARMLRLPSAVAPLVLGEDDQIVIQETIEDMVRDALSEMSADWRETATMELPE